MTVKHVRHYVYFKRKILIALEKLLAMRGMLEKGIDLANFKIVVGQQLGQESMFEIHLSVCTWLLLHIYPVWANARLKTTKNGIFSNLFYQNKQKPNTHTYVHSKNRFCFSQKTINYVMHLYS